MSLDKSKQYDAMRKAAERYSGDPISITIDYATSTVNVLPLLGSERALFAEHLAAAIKRRQHDFIGECLAEAKRQAIDQAENTQRSAAAALERLQTRTTNPSRRRGPHMNAEHKTPIQSRCSFCGGDLVELLDAPLGSVVMRCLPCGVSMQFDAGAERIAGRDRGREVGFTAAEREAIRLLLRIVRDNIKGPMRAPKRADDIADLEAALAPFSPARREAEDRGREARAIQFYPVLKSNKPGVITIEAYRTEFGDDLPAGELHGLTHGIRYWVYWRSAGACYVARDHDDAIRGDETPVDSIVVATEADLVGGGGAGGTHAQRVVFDYTPGDQAKRVEDKFGGERDTLNPERRVFVGDPRADQVKRMVDRFLAWRLPDTFLPDGGVSFKKPDRPEWWPVGTNVLTADEATAMVRHMLEGNAIITEQSHAELLTECDRLEQAVRWCLGEVGEFPHAPPLRPGSRNAFYWRDELRRRAFGDTYQSTTSKGTQP